MTKSGKENNTSSQSASRGLVHGHTSWGKGENETVAKQLFRAGSGLQRKRSPIACVSRVLSKSLSWGAVAVHADSGDQAPRAFG